MRNTNVAITFYYNSVLFLLLLCFLDTVHTVNGVQPFINDEHTTADSKEIFAHYIVKHTVSCNAFWVSFK